jgi:tetratricopeptide (TPR) repeat protein
MLRNNNTSSGPGLDRAIALHQSGQYLQAIEAYRAVLAGSEGDSTALSLLGLALAQAGRTPEGLPLLERALAAQPDSAGLRLNLARGLLLAGATDRAETEVRRILDLSPIEPRALELLGDISAWRSDMAAAATHWRAALAQAFSVPLVFKIVRYLIAESHFDRADAVLSDLIPHFMDDSRVHALRGELLAARRDWTSLERVGRFMTERFPTFTDGWRWFATALFETGKYPEAAAAYRHVLDFEASDADALAAYSGLCIHALEFEEASRALDAASAIDPDHPGMLQRRALVHLYHGRFAEAEDCCRRCLARDPENVSAYTTLSRVRRGRLEAAELDTVTRIAENPAAPLDSRIAAAFASGHAHDARGDEDAAMAAYGRAHELARERDRIEGRVYDRAAGEARAARLAAQLDLEQLPALPPDSPRPIFIVGMPRSGTTLAECVIGAHADVVACGERMAMRQVLHAWLALVGSGRRPDGETLAAWREQLLRGLPALGSARHFTDKHPLNFEAVGLIARMFPEAAIVWMRRDPVETCVSVYRQEFNKRWGFVHRLGDIGHYYALHERVMATWIERLPGRITEVRYETFAADIAREAPALIGAVGLEWDPRCLEFQSSRRPIATFSTVDARDPVAVRSGRGARYRRHLGELLAALAAAGVTAVDGGTIGEHDAVAG